jgi:hypothetical protein
MDLSGAKKKKNLSKKLTNLEYGNKSPEKPVSSHQININIAFPSSGNFKKLWLSLINNIKILGQGIAKIVQRILPSKKILNFSLVAVILVSSSLLVKTILVDSKSNSNSDEVKGIESKKKEKPDFVIYYPSDTKSKEMSYDANKKVASFPDQIETIPITVSQQKLPDPFKANPVVELEKLAKQINANTKLETTSTNAFMGQSVRGPQTVVFVKDQTLVFIKSDSQVAISSWNKYLDSLMLQ